MSLPCPGTLPQPTGTGEREETWGWGGMGHTGLQGRCRACPPVRTPSRALAWLAIPSKGCGAHGRAVDSLLCCWLRAWAVVGMSPRSHRFVWLAVKRRR